MKDTVFDKAVKAFGTHRGRYEYDNAINGYFNAYYSGEEVYIPVGSIDETTGKAKPGVTEVEGRMMYIVCTEIDEFGNGNIEGIMNIKLDELREFVMDDMVCGGMIVNPWTAGFVMTREMVDEANAIY